MNGKSILFLYCLFLSAEATCSIENRTELDTHLVAYFTDPTATHACGNISTWDVSNVTDFTDLFRDRADFNANISNWDTSSVTSLERTFYGATSFTGDGVSNWNTSSVTNLY